MKAKYSWNEILPLLSLSIWEKFQSTISWVMAIFNGLKVSSINFLNSALSISSSSAPYLFCSFIEATALCPKKWVNYFLIKNVHILGKWFFHHGRDRFCRNASPTVIEWWQLNQLLNYRLRGLWVRFFKEWSCDPCHKLWRLVRSVF